MVSSWAPVQWLRRGRCARGHNGAAFIVQVALSWNQQFTDFGSRGLTLPSRGRATSSFACCRPPLMSNVRRTRMKHWASAKLRSASRAGQAVSSLPRFSRSAYFATFSRGRPATALNQLSLAKKKASLRVAVSEFGFGSAHSAVAHGHQPNSSVNRTSNSGLRPPSAAGYLKR